MIIMMIAAQRKLLSTAFYLVILLVRFRNVVSVPLIVLLSEKSTDYVLTTKRVLLF